MIRDDAELRRLLASPPSSELRPKLKGCALRHGVLLGTKDSTAMFQKKLQRALDFEDSNDDDDDARGSPRRASGSDDGRAGERFEEAKIAPETEGAQPPTDEADVALPPATAAGRRRGLSGAARAAILAACGFLVHVCIRYASTLQARGVLLSPWDLAGCREAPSRFCDVFGAVRDRTAAALDSVGGAFGKRARGPDGLDGSAAQRPSSEPPIAEDIQHSFAAAVGDGPFAVDALHEVSSFAGVWASARRRHVASLFFVGDDDSVLAAAVAAISKASRSTAVLTFEFDAEADWTAARSHIAQARRDGSNALVVVRGCERRGAHAAAPVEHLIDPLLNRPFDLGIGGPPVDLGHAAIIWTAASLDSTTCLDLLRHGDAQRAALDAIRALWGGNLAEGFYNRIQHAALLCRES